MTDKEITDNYNKLGFLSSILIDIIDKLEGTNQYKKELKFHLNRARVEAEKVLNDHFKMYNDFGLVKQNDDESVHSFDIYLIISKAYEDLFSKEPNEIASIAHIVKAIEDNNIDYKQIDIPYKPAEM